MDVQNRLQVFREWGRRTGGVRMHALEVGPAGRDRQVVSEGLTGRADGSRDG